MYLGVKGVIVKSFARIHRANLVNFGLLPMIFENPADYDKIDLGDKLKIENLRKSIQSGKIIEIKNLTKNSKFTVKHDMTEREVNIMLAGGLLNYTKEHASKN